ncbi:DHCW motif cupin fold protein [Sandaracinus amylolyticus]|uniref:Cupin 2 conserved barrel domain-containing protein n=1 Tax=Sandaracinus amylolyticus TaxID=927083 RepID=A0A0F6YGU0_9BACT|nr:DHCW motif cupin fold protein [Sandaracinus amylolyticus]AKF04310.1 hypothetical protein DB32_001459 [Sandaracinus amylolyticus]
MKIESVPFTTTDLRTIAPTIHAGLRGEAIWRTFEMGNVRVRRVEYTPGYEADHWCERGHVLHVLEGTLVTHLADGRVLTLTEGMTYVVAEGAEPHRSSAPGGATLFIVD